MTTPEPSHNFLPVRRLRPQAVLPVRATSGSAGLDLHACMDTPLTLEPGCRVMIPTGRCHSPGSRRDDLCPQQLGYKIWNRPF